MRSIVFALVLFLLALDATSTVAETRESPSLRPPGSVQAQVHAASAVNPAGSPHRSATIHLDRIPLAAALEQLAARADLKLVYSPSMLEGVRVSCACDAANVAATLDLLLADTGFDWVEADGQLLIERRSRAQVASTAITPRHAPPAVQAGTITGRVVEAGTLRPLAGAQVLVVGTGTGTLTSRDGRFILLNVPDGPVTVRTQMIGFGTVEQLVTVQPGATATVDFQLEQQALALDAVVVTGTAGVTRRRELGNAVTQIDASVAETEPIQNVSDLLRGRATGVVVHGGQGAVGTATTIKIRGSSTMRLTNDGPLVYIDGVRVNNQMTGVGGSSISRIDDLDPTTVESIEVIKGPAAATLYGTEASNGVINITTKKGALGGTEWSIMTRQGANWLPNAAERFPTNWGVNPSTGEIESLNLVQLESDRGNPIFSTGRSQFYGLNVGGGTSNLQYFISGSSSSDEGVLQENWAKNYNARANITASPSNTVTLEANSGLMLTRVSLAPSSITNDLVRSSPKYLNDDRRGFRRAPPEAHYASSDTQHEANRMTVGLKMTHTPLEWFTHRLTFGMDVTDQANITLSPRLDPDVARFFTARAAAGSKTVDRQSVLYTSFDYGASVNRALSEAFSSSTSAGLQVYSRATRLTWASGEGFPAPGVETIGGAGTRTGNDDFLENNTVGVYFQEQIGWRDRLFVAAAIRADDNSAFGEEFSLVYYPKISGSWVVSEEAFWGLDFIDSFRLRAAYGESGQQPDVFDALRTYAPRAAADGGSTVRPNSPGNPQLGPERGKEIEAGFDAAFFDNRVSLDLTFYDQTTADAIVARNVAPSSGFTGRQFVNIGEISNRGVEVSLDARVFESESIDWDLGISTATNRNRITELGLEGFLELGWTTRHMEGYPVGSYFAPRVIQAELNSAGRATNVLCDDGQGGGVSCDEAPWLFAGHPDPNIEGSVTSGVTLGDRLRLQALVDFKLGQSKYSTQMWWRYSADRNTELNMFPERFDPREVAAADLGNFGEFQFWVPQADFARLREVSASYSLPDEWTGRFGGTRGQIGLAARNLALWTTYLPYPYQDPEVLNPIETFSNRREAQDTSGMPPLTSLELTLQLSF